MLLEFRVKNFRSIRAEQKLSLVANKDVTHIDTHVFDNGAKTTPPLLKSTVLYGANASGKSNLINALAFMQDVVASSATQIREGDLFSYSPFKLDAHSAAEPTEFEITFVEDGVRYQYGFALRPERVVEEWLLVYKNTKPQMWFSRKFDSNSDKEHYEFGSHLTGKRSLWQDSTRKNALFLSKAVDLNSDKLRPIFLWIVNNLMIIGTGTQPIFDFSIKHIQTETGKTEILNFLISADMSISEIKLENRKMKRISLEVKGDSSTQHVSEVETFLPTFLHQGTDGSAIFELTDESTGTQRLFAFAGPILDVLQHGRVLIVDELDNSLHTLIIRFMLTLFHSVKTNPNGAQLIFSTHNTTLLHHEIFRRDQIWFVEKDSSHATQLYPLSDFHVRKKEAWENGYLGGRYGALPFIDMFNL